MSRRAWNALGAAAVITWLFGIVAAYFWAHKPFDGAIVAGLGRTLAHVFVWLGVVWVATGFGRRVVGGWLGDEDALARTILAAGVGLGLLSLFVLGLGSVGMLRAPLSGG